MRDQIQTLLAGLVVLVLGYFGYLLLFEREEEVMLAVVAAAGPVTRTDAVGQRAPVTPGTPLLPQDALAVGPGGSAEIAVGESGGRPGSRLSLGAASSIRVVGADAAGVRVELAEGRVSARVRPGSSSLAVSSRGRSVYASDADFSMAVDPDGALAVQAERGSVQLAGLGPSEVLQAGEQISSLPGQPAVVGAVPTALLLEVAWPTSAETREEAVTVQGRTSPYADVTLTGASAPVKVRADGEGRFTAALRLAEGVNALQVQARDPFGELVDSTYTMELDTRVEPLSVGDPWGSSP